MDRDTGKRTVVGIFDTLTAGSFPFALPPFVIYAVLTDGLGHVPLRMVIKDIDEEEPLVERAMTVGLPNPLAVAHVRIRINGLLIPRAGQYLFELTVGGESICHRRLNINLEEE